MTTRTLRNGDSRDLPIEPGQSMAVVAVSGTYSASVIAGLAAPSTIATNATGGTYGPYATGAVIRLQSSAASEIDFDVDVTPAIVSDTHVFAQTDAATGRIAISGVLTELEEHFNTPRIVALGDDLTDFVRSSNGTAAVFTVDGGSPFGGSAIKIAIPAGNTNTDIGYQQLDVAAFDDHIAFRVWIEDYTKVQSIETFVGSAAYAKYTRYTYNVAAAATALFNGEHVIYAGPAHTPIGGGTFVYGSDNLGVAKIRITSNSATNVWLQRIEIPQRQRPLVAMTFDDGDASWKTLLSPLLNSYKIPATFAVMSSWLNDGTHLSTADITGMVADGHQITSHNVNNLKYITNQTLSAYVTDYVTARKALEAVGVPPHHLSYHAYVQGGMDQSLITRLSGNGVRMARNVNPQRINLYGSGLGGQAMSLSVVTLGGTGLAAMLEAVDNVYKYGGLLVFMGHEFIASGTPAGSEGLISNVQAVCDRISGYGIDTVTMHKAHGYLRALGKVS